MSSENLKQVKQNSLHMIQPSQNQLIVHIQNLITKSKKFIKQSQINEAIISLQSAQKHLKKQTPQELTLDIYFTKSTCLMQKKQYSHSLQYLNKVYNIRPEYKENITFLISICQFNLGQIQLALESLNQDNNIQQKIDKLYFRVKINVKSKKFNDAQNDLKLILQKSPSHFPSLRMLLEIYQIQQKYSKALTLIDMHQLTVQNKIQEKQLLMKKVQFAYLNDQYEVANHNIFLLQTQHHLKQSKLSYLKGKISLKKSDFQLAIINFNEAITINQGIKYLHLSLCELIIHFLRQRDFYEALSYCQRVTYLQQDKRNSHLIENLNKLTEGLTLMMKRNFTEGLKIVSGINVDPFEQLKATEHRVFLLNLYYNAKAFSYFSLSQYQQALLEYKKLSVYPSDQEYLPCHYNMKLCQGVIQMLINRNDQTSIQLFQKSLEYLKRPQPYFYISVILTQKNLNNGSSTQIFMKILTILETGLNINPTSEMHYYRALIYLYLGMNNQALQDIQKAIQISQDNVTDHFYVKGLIYLLQENYEQAISEFQVALSIDQKLPKVILQKAKCQIKQEDVEQAYQDLEIYREVCPIDKDQRLWELFFLLNERKFEEIINFDVDEYQSNINEHFLQALSEIKQKACFFLGRFQEAGPAGKLILALLYGSYADLLKLLAEAEQLDVNIGPLSCIDLKFIKIYVLIKLNNYQLAITTLQEIQRTLCYDQIGEGYQEQNEFKLLLSKINLVFVLFLQNQRQKAMEKLEVLISQIQEGQILNQLQHFLEKLRQIIDTKQAKQTQKEPFNLDLFTDRQMLSSCLPIQTHNNVNFKILIPFPILLIEQLNPNNEEVLQEFTFRDIQNRPEAPWIKRGEFGILFTNQIREFSNLHLNTQQTEQHQHTVTDNKNTLASLKLGSDVLLKLQKLNKQQKQNI